MRLIKLCVLGLVTVAAVACGKQEEPQTPVEARSEDESKAAQQRAEMQEEHTAQQADLAAEQRKQAAQREADLEKQRAEAQADRVKLDADIKARLEKTDARLTDLTPRIAKAKPDARAKANELVKKVQEQRAALEKRRSELPSVPQDGWEKNKSDLDSSMKDLEKNLDELEKLVKP